MAMTQAEKRAARLALARIDVKDPHFSGIQKTLGDYQTRIYLEAQVFPLLKRLVNGKEQFLEQDRYVARQPGSYGPA